MKKFILCMLFYMIIVSGCCKDKKNNLKFNDLFKENQESVDVNSIYSSIDKEEILVYIEKSDYKLNLYEPKEGIYLGAYIPVSGNDDIKEFEDLVEKNHAIYSYHTKLKLDIPLNWILSCVSKMKVPNIIITPSDDTNPFDIDLLESIAKQYGELYIPIFLNFYPYQSEKGYSSEEYIEFYRKAREIFKLYASNVAFVWTVNQGDVINSKSYYPGDDYVDWVGINLYNFLEKESCSEKDIFNDLDYFYYMYQGRKPIMISKLGISHFSNKDCAYKILEAASEIKNIYNKILDDYHNIKAINYMNFNEINSLNGNMYKYNFSVTDDANILNSYKSTINKPKYLSIVDFSTKGEKVKLLMKSPFIGYKIGDDIYISEKSFTHNIKNVKLENMDEYSFIINSEKYYKLDILSKNLDYKIDIYKNKVIIRNIKED